METADIVLSHDKPLERQMRAILAAAGEHAHDVHWRPRPDVPHGGVVQAPAHVAERYRLSIAPPVEPVPEEEPEVEGDEIETDDGPIEEETGGDPEDSGEAEGGEETGTGTEGGDAGTETPAEGGTSRRRRRTAPAEGSAGK